MKDLDPGARLEYERELLIGAFQETLLALLDSLDVSQRELARRMHISESRISQVVSGGASNLTLDSLSRIGHALQIRFEIIAVETEDGVELPTWAHRMIHRRRAPDSLTSEKGD